MSDYLPRTDADFSDWLHNFITYANANLADPGVAERWRAVVTAVAAG